MKRLAIGLLALLVVPMTVSIGQSAPASTTQNVNVVNTPSVMVANPVTSVGITGIPSVSISGTPSVNVSNTVPVTVTGTTRTPYQKFVRYYNPAAEDMTTIDVTLLRVPSDKRLVINNISGRIWLGPVRGGMIREMSLGISGSSPSVFYLPLNPAGYANDLPHNAREYTFSTPVLAFVEPGQSVTIRAYAGWDDPDTWNGGSYFLFFMDQYYASEFLVTGYLENQ